MTREARESKPRQGRILTENARGSRTVKRTRGWRLRPDEGRVRRWRHEEDTREGRAVKRTPQGGPHTPRGMAAEKPLAATGVKKIGSGLGGRLKNVIKPNPNPNPWL
jgi:hypothetical protein